MAPDKSAAHADVLPGPRGLMIVWHEPAAPGEPRVQRFEILDGACDYDVAAAIRASRVQETGEVRDAS